MGRADVAKYIDRLGVQVVEFGFKPKRMGYFISKFLTDRRLVDGYIKN